MKHELFIKILGFLLFISFILSCGEGKNIIISTHNESEKEYIKNILLYNDYHVEIIDNGNYLTIKQITVDMLLEIKNVIQLEMDTIKMNIKNVSTIKNGNPYVRKYIKVSAENGVEIIEDIETNFRLIYNPTHPEAISSGEKQGYVEYPNVDIITEMINLIRVNRLYESILYYIRNNYKNVVF